MSNIHIHRVIRAECTGKDWQLFVKSNPSSVTPLYLSKILHTVHDPEILQQIKDCQEAYSTIYQSQLQQSWLKKCSQSHYFNGQTTQPCLLDTAYYSVQISYFNLKKDILTMSDDSITKVQNCIADLLQANRFFNEKLMMLNIQCQFLKKKSKENQQNQDLNEDEDMNENEDVVAKLTAMPEVGISPGKGWSPGWPHNEN